MGAGKAVPRAFLVRGMCCAEEARQVSAAVSPLVGGADNLSFDLINGKLKVHAPQDIASDESIIAAVNRTGLKAEPAEAAEHDHGHPEMTAGPRLAMWLSGALLIAGYGVQWAIGGDLLATLAETGELAWPARLLYAGSALAGGWFIFPRAWAAARQLRPDMNLLMTIAVIGAAALGEWAEAAMVSFLFAVSLWLESWSVSRARREVEKLMKLTPETATLLESNGSTREVPAAEVPVGVVLLVRPGERVALDGVVEDGESDVNQAAITGESLPVTKQPGATVLAGSINGTGALKIRTTKSASDSTVARIIDMVTNAQQGRSQAERWVDRFARWYTPAVIVLAVLLGAVPLAIGGDSGSWIYRSLVLLVAACPCALVISTPVTIVAGLASAARHGVLVKGGAFLEVPAALNTVALDKTGTLTTGKLAVESVSSLGKHTDAEVLTLAAALEAHSEHPIARAIVHHAQAQGLKPQPANDLEAITGKGARATIAGVEYWIGSHRLLADRSADTPELLAKLGENAAAGRTVVMLGSGSEVLGMVILSDTLRDEAKALVTELQTLGVKHAVMLTGDNQPTALRIAAMVGITEVYAELLPEDKLRLIEEFKRRGTVAMVGDGVNDAPALATVDLSISLGAAGSDVALETADVALMSDSLARLPWLIRHSRRAMGVLRQNIAFALAIKLIFVVLATMGISTLWMAIAADMGASLLVTLNGARLFAVNKDARQN
jgi:Zn2+/Cd2+-exporting ATPase